MEDLNKAIVNFIEVNNEDYHLNSKDILQAHSLMFLFETFHISDEVVNFKHLTWTIIEEELRFFLKINGMSKYQLACAQLDQTCEDYDIYTDIVIEIISIVYHFKQTVVQEFLNKMKDNLKVSLISSIKLLNFSQKKIDTYSNRRISQKFKSDNNVNYFIQKIDVLESELSSANRLNDNLKDQNSKIEKELAEVKIIMDLNKEEIFNLNRKLAEAIDKRESKRMSMLQRSSTNEFNQNDKRDESDLNIYESHKKMLENYQMEINLKNETIQMLKAKELMFDEQKEEFIFYKYQNDLLSQKNNKLESKLAVYLSLSNSTEGLNLKISKLEETIAQQENLIKILQEENYTLRKDNEFIEQKFNICKVYTSKTLLQSRNDLNNIKSNIVKNKNKQTITSIADFNYKQEILEVSNKSMEEKENSENFSLEIDKMSRDSSNHLLNFIETDLRKQSNSNNSVKFSYGVLPNEIVASNNSLDAEQCDVLRLMYKLWAEQFINDQNKNMTVLNKNYSFRKILLKPNFTVL